jgi:hypothetical protein
LNDALQKAGKTPIHVREADKNLADDDLVQMVNAGLIPASLRGSAPNCGQRSSAT